MQIQEDELKTLKDVKAYAREAELASKLAMANVKNIVLELALKYGLKDGDTIADDGTVNKANAADTEEDANRKLIDMVKQG